MCKNERILKIDIFWYVTNRKCVKYPENTYRMQWKIMKMYKNESIFIICNANSQKFVKMSNILKIHTEYNAK